MKKSKVLTSVMAGMMALSLISTVPVKASEPYISNPSFEEEINKAENQLYKAERTDEMAHDGKYSIKVGMERPEDESQVPSWRYTSGKGSVNVVIKNIEPNTTYKVTTWVYNKTNVKMSTGVVDVEGGHTSSPWKLASNIKTAQFQSTGDEWRKNEHTITTGPRTKEIYAFAYTEWTGDFNGCGLFYVDDFSIEKVKTNETKEKSSINYTVKDTKSFPETIPAIQEFKATEGSFRLDVKNQVFSSDKFSMAKTKYLAESMVKKGIIKNYTINQIDNINEGKGIVVAKKTIDFKLPEIVKESKIDAYQIDIKKDKVVLYSDYIEGIQNGTMTLLQAFTQRKVLPAGCVHDYTDQVVRGLQVDSGRRYYSIEWLKEQVEQMAYYKQNKLQLRLKDNEGIRYDSKVAAPFVNKKAGFWTQKEVDELVNYANRFNIEVIPEIDFPGHAEQDAFYYKNWGLGGSTKALDFSMKEVRDYMIAVYKEAADFFHAKTIHIGGDEFFQSGYTPKGKTILENWVRKETGNQAATDYDALKLFFNMAAEELFKKDLKVLVWNDNINDLNGTVPLNKNIVVDFWAGGFYGSIIASKAANEGYNIMSSSSSNYHDLWPQQNNMKLDRPLPKDTYEQFTRYNYSKSSTYYYQDEVLKENLDKSLGQMFPIWDDAHGYVPEYILSRTLYPRYAVFSLKTWGADYQTPINYAEFERLIFTLESPVSEVRKQVEINYNTTDLALVTSIISNALETRMQETTGYVKENAENLYKEVIDIISKIATYTPKSWESMQKALESAKTVIADKNATQEDIDKATDVLNKAIANLAIVKADKEALLATIDKVSAYNESTYTKKSWQALQDALTTAKEVLALDDGNPSQVEVDKATKNLTEAIAALVRKPSKSILTYYMNKVKQLNAEDYTEESWAEVDKAYATAKSLNENDSEDVTQAEINAAGEALHIAINNLVKKDAPQKANVSTHQELEIKVNKTELQAAIDEAESINPNQYKDKDGFTTTMIKDIIYRFENLEYLEDGKVIVKYVDENGKEIAKSTTLEGEIGTEYQTTAPEIEGYTLEVTPENANGKFDRKEQVITYQYKAKVTIDVDPEKPDIEKPDGEKPDTEQPTNPNQNQTVKTADTNNLNLFISLAIVSMLGYCLLERKKSSHNK